VSQPDETHGCPICNEPHPPGLLCVTREPEPLPLAEQKRRAALWRRADALLADPAALAAFVARIH
jgi:hypothetical protein